MSSGTSRVGSRSVRNAALGCFLLAFTGAAGCGPKQAWSADDSPTYDESHQGEFIPPTARERSLLERYRVTRIGATRPENPAENPEVVVARIAVSRTEGRVLGKFRNTYYDFPSEAAFSGERVALFNASCGRIASVRRDFHDALCVQGSGVLVSGTPVSFAKRDCSCARECPRTGQKICYQPLDKARFPWGRGAAGTAITPLMTVAVDTDVIPMNSSLYIPEYEGLPLDRAGSSYHDGCFLAQDRGLKVQGHHVDIFTGEPTITRLWNELMPSNRGVTVVLGSPRCATARSRP